MRTSVLDELRQNTSAAFAAMFSLVLVPLTAVSAAEHSPYTMSDEAWITLSGTVTAVDRDSFVLDFGDGTIIVEMDDGDRDADAYKLLSGDKVTVTGQIDDDFLETTKIEASSVYVDSIGTTFFSSSVDEETSDRLVAEIVVPVTAAHATIHGVVTDVDTSEFTVDAGASDVRVDVSEMAFNPLDDEGYLKIAEGDRVKVSGEVDKELFERYEIDADYIVKKNM